ncbi:MAG TPA: glycoside hydrolase family 15 protein [Phycisphaerae bacterium]|nr:glycoside hydrolase family 15 protein [Phycisphaerae bacterium]
MYLPTAATGNSLSLATFGAAGEIMGFFYPHLDFAQNVREGMLAVHLHDWGENAFLWCFADRFERSQHFRPGTNILVTNLRHRDCDLTVELTDLLPPDEHALVRRIAILRGQGAPRLTVMHYFNLSLGDVDRRNAVHYLPQQRTIVQQFRDVSLALAASWDFGLHTGTVQPGGGSATKEAMAHGHLAGPDQCMGDVDFGVALSADDEPRWEVVLVLAGARERAQAGDDARRLADIPFEQHERGAGERCHSILSRAARDVPPDWTEAYDRAVLVLHDLFDAETGTFIAAPEFDPYYSHSGGYGYCWPRDAAVSAMTAARIGFPEMAEAFFDWCRRSQLDDGHWFQRYWTDASEAPSWCVRENEIQLDQTCAVLHAASLFADLLGEGRSGFIEQFRETARRAADAIIAHIGEDGLHRQSADLWEGSWGSFAYTQAAMVAALREGHRVFDTPTPDLERVRRVLFDRFWNPDRRCWAKRIDSEGHVETTLDSSCLGLIEPWGVLDPADPHDRDLATQTLDTLTEHLSVDVKGGRALLRFENESYMGGAAGCVNTLWAALCRLRLAAVLEGDSRAWQIDTARGLVATALANTNPTGQLPELIPRVDAAYWAAPHGWASSLFIECMLALQSLGSS